MRRLYKYIKVFILLVLPVYLALLANSMQNMHVHVLSNGMVVKHAHPLKHDSEGDKHHSHSDSEICYYQAFFLDYLDTSTPFEPVRLTTVAVDTDEQPLAFFYSYEQFNLNDLRGPPVV
ncbi:hypothetical protein [uncultured Sunxiuqinia sp.]|uniref:hypothetical protein n=1 Tax=Sunxiuqinia rutila TaxID=1397841 RepID=UPI00260E0A6D|nr:hypothetical protein [uncultured Sunxiuqinia sp.]